ncbi:hypothetical protein [Cupriavidus metallidurans]|uniref:KfrB domain-containing protein n=1 Tax=Cupriavidus metallidurans TaxID=119219 RepID=UPI00131A30AB|nr:hypothetical protein [Cupriavidus metallidurans]
MTDNTNTPPFLLVRVQDDLHGAYVTERGLRLKYERDSEFAEYRNTLHWSVNCAVADHPYGRFNEATDGSLIGKIVIIADPRELPVPAGLGEVDTWYRMDASPRVDGSLDRGLDVGKNATIIAPVGTKVPDGAKVIHYEGGITERNAAISQVLGSAGIEPRIAGMWSWQNTDGIGRWATDTADRVYGSHADDIHIGPHSSSADDAIEAGARLGAMVERFETERLYTRGDGAEVPMYGLIAARIHGQRETLNVILEGMTPDERSRSGAYYEWRLSSLSQLEERALTINENWLTRMEEMDELLPRAPLPMVPPPLPMVPPPLPMAPPPLPMAPPPLPMAPPPLPMAPPPLPMAPPPLPMAPPPLPMAPPPLPMAPPPLPMALSSSSMAVPSKPDGLFIGKILGIADGMVTQRIGRAGEAVVHSVADLSRPVEVGEIAEIAYKDGKGVVRQQDRGQVRGVDR